MYKWQEIIDEFLTDIQVKNYTSFTIYNYKAKFKNIKDYFLSNNIEFVDEVTKQDVKKWIISLQKNGMQSSAINITTSRLKKLFEYMIEEGYITTSPFLNIKRLKIQKKVIYPLNDDEIKQLLKAAKTNRHKHIAQRDTVIFMMLLETGLRVSELANIKNDDILDNQILIRHGKGNKDRAVAITPILKKEMYKYDRIKKAKYKNDDIEYYFVSYKKTGLKPPTIWHIMNALKKQVKLRDVVRFSGHTLRHTYAHMAIRNGMDIYTLSLNMGHSQVSMTQKYLQTLKSDDFVKESIKYSTLKNLR
ncbi:conserved hypothetical protein [Lactococcus piscium]|nr:conserved hypothetical protein [Lactococcus piscium]